MLSHGGQLTGGVRLSSRRRLLSMAMSNIIRKAVDDQKVKAACKQIHVHDYVHKQRKPISANSGLRVIRNKAFQALVYTINAPE